MPVIRITPQRFAPVLLRLLCPALAALASGCLAPQNPPAVPPGAGVARPVPQIPVSPGPTTAPPAREVVIATWNVRGYPESRRPDTVWLHAQLRRLAPDVLCCQEIANQAKVSLFCQTDPVLREAVFCETSDPMDNPIFAGTNVSIEPLPVEYGFQHPAQVAYVTCGGFDAVVVNIHLSWTNRARREAEKVHLRSVTAAMLARDPDVVVVGDFNTEGAALVALASQLGLQVMTPTNGDTATTTHAGHSYDHFLVSPDLAAEETVSARVAAFAEPDLATARRVSDHLPVTARFRTDPRFRDRP